MDNIVTLTAAVIGVIGAIVGPPIGARIGRKKERESLEQQSRDSAESLQKAQTSRIGLTAESLQSHMVVINDEGDAKVGRSWRGVQAASGHAVSRIPGRFFTATPGSSIASPPELSGVRSPKRLELSLAREERSCDYSVDIPGSLTEEDGPIDYVVSCSYHGTVLMDEDEVKRAYADDHFDHDYFCFDVAVPLRKLELEISFSSTKPPSIEPVAFWGYSEHRHEAELARTGGGFELTPNGARFTVADPLFGFRYAIAWCFDPSYHR